MIDFQKDYEEQRDGSSKLAYVGDYIFGFTTYDEEKSEQLTSMCLLSIQNIIRKTVFNFIENDDNYMCYILSVNLLDKFDFLEWGTSVRGAWIKDGATFHFNDKNHDVTSFFVSLINWVYDE